MRRMLSLSTGGLMSERTCNGPCGKALPEERFELVASASGKQHRRNTCCTCRSRARRAAPPDVEPDLARAEACLPYGGPLEAEIVEALRSHGSLAAAAEALGMTVRLARGKLQELERAAARAGWSPAHDMKATAPAGFRVKGVSTYYKVGEDGAMVPSGQWVKTKSDSDSRLEALAAACAAAAEPLRDLRDPLPAPVGLLNDDLLCLYPMGDPHLGMHAWAAETGSNFDLAIAEQNLFTAVDQLVALAPPSRECLLVNLGDFYHADSGSATTTAGTRVDVDTRQGKVYATGIRVLMRLIDRCLQKHELVNLVCEIGNHDENSALMLTACMGALYAREPRVRVDTSPAAHHWFRFGKCLIGITHGNGAKHSALGQVMACDRPQDWGETEHRYFYVGHVHHDTVKELPGVTVETFRTLAPKDAWHASKGYRSGQDMKCDVLHRRFGRVQRNVIGIAQIMELLS
jgi:hypothetical protein